MSNRTAIPAQPGVRILQFQLGGGQLDRLPIIGWVVGLDCGRPANPITVRGTENVWDIRSAVMSPDGSLSIVLRTRSFTRASRIGSLVCSKRRQHEENER